MTKKFCNNVLMILKHDNLPVGRFEKDHGLSTGSLSRIANGGRSNLPLDIALKIAESLGNSIDEILLTDWVEVFDEEDRQTEIEILEMQQREIESRLAELKS